MILAGAFDVVRGIVVFARLAERAVDEVGQVVEADSGAPQGAKSKVVLITKSSKEQDGYKERKAGVRAGLVPGRAPVPDP
ncbi:putative transposase [Bradyrhizobium diazoefficiens]|nr:putative transposase [Bradyrhizobium diazoefficiens]